MTLTLTDISDRAAWQAPESEPATPSNDDAWLAWPVRVKQGDQQHTLLLDHTQGDPAPTRSDVEAHLAQLGEDHALAGARLAREITKRAYLDRFDAGELRAIRDADMGLGDWTQPQRTAAGAAMTYLDHTARVDLTDPKTIELVEALEQAGLLAQGRAAEVLQ
jgi:hypothetical protein